MKKCQAGFNNMAMFTLRNPVVLRCVRRRGQVRDAMGGEELAYSDKLATIIRVECLDLCLKPVLHNRFEGDKGFVHLRFLLQRI